MNEQSTLSFDVKAPYHNGRGASVGVIDSYKNFESSLNCLSNKEIGYSFEILEKIYFKLKPLYYPNEHVGLWDEVIKNELEFFEIKSNNLGIDLIVNFGDEHHAIQCKYHADSISSVSYRETSKFISLLENNA